MSEVEEIKRTLEAMESTASNMEKTLTKLEIQMGIPIRSETDQAAEHL